jgi:transposase
LLRESGNMKILHILNDGPTDLSGRIIDEQSKDHEVKIIELFNKQVNKQVSYKDVIEDIFSHDKVISW